MGLITIVLEMVGYDMLGARDKYPRGNDNTR